jgi:hypothetical protein
MNKLKIKITPTQAAMLTKKSNGDLVVSGMDTVPKRNTESGPPQNGTSQQQPQPQPQNQPQPRQPQPPQNGGKNSV